MHSFTCLLANNFFFIVIIQNVQVFKNVMYLKTVIYINIMHLYYINLN